MSTEPIIALPMARTPQATIELQNIPTDRCEKLLLELRAQRGAISKQIQAPVLELVARRSANPGNQGRAGVSPHTGRNQAIFAALDAGEKTKTVAAKHSISEGRVRQLYAVYEQKNKRGKWRRI